MEDVHEFGGGGGLGLGVDVGEHGDFEFRADFGQHAQAGFQARAAKGLGGGAVGFVEAGFENVKDAELRAGFFEGGGDLQAEFFVFNGARSGNQAQAPGRIEMFPGQGIVEHMSFLAVRGGKVNPGRKKGLRRKKAE